MIIKPLFDKIVLEPVEAETKTKSGLYLTEASREKPATCKVIAISEELNTPIKVGDLVLLARFAGTEVTDNGKTYRIARDVDILAIVPEEESEKE